MKPLPHRYVVDAEVEGNGAVVTTVAGLDTLEVDSPEEFDGPGDHWSPESLLVAAVADCFVLTFRSIARASKFSWTALACDVTGTLDRVDRTLQFTHFDIRARLEAPGGVDKDLAMRLLDKSHRGCLVANSLKATIALNSEVSATRDLTPA